MVDADCKIAFWLQNLVILKLELEKLNIPLLVLSVSQKTIVNDFKEILRKYDISTLHFNILFEPDERKYDDAILKICKTMEIDVNRYQQSCILPPGTVTKNDSTPYRVFTAFKKKWLTTLKAEDYICLPKPRERPLSSNIKSTDLAIFLEHYPATYDVQQWPAGEVVAQRRLRYFIKKKIIDYAKLRDFSAQESTSSLCMRSETMNSYFYFCII